MRSSRSRGALAVVLAGLLVSGLTAAACSGQASKPTLSGAWVRATSTVDQESAGYLVISNPGAVADTLMDVFSPDASNIEIHQTSTDANGMTGMTGMESLAVPAGATITLAPGGMHLMIMGLHRVLAPGGTLELHLAFEHAGTIVVQAAIRQG